MKKQNFKNLILLARQECCPYVDVSDEVISAVSLITRQNTALYRTYTWMGTASAAIAACILIAATLLWQSNSDSVGEIMTYVSWVTQ
jgi:hypothetical protein